MSEGGGIEVYIRSRASGPRSLGALLLALYAVDLAYLSARPDTPPLYLSGVRYSREPREVRGRVELWDSVPVVLAQGWGDCDDLAAWRAAELSLSGVYALPVLVEVAPFSGRYHVVVWRSDGQWEDPSARLGMEVI